MPAVTINNTVHLRSILTSQSLFCNVVVVFLGVSLGYCKLFYSFGGHVLSSVLCLSRHVDVAKLRGRAFAHGAMGRRIDPSWGRPIELFLVPASAP